ncbi:MAG: pyridoxamine 5'-phosphate oxidase [Opitutaceae bacterium]|nr:pyridoxamine 5'-phosphate oxidase [Cytophagales bacterium]
MDIASIRKDYKLKELSEKQIASSPDIQFKFWFEEAVKAEVPEVNAMVLSTVGQNSRPSARVVLVKDFDKNGIVFYTNYKSQKAIEMLGNPFASLTFFWPQLERQVRVEGIVEKVSEDESIRYYNSRPWESRVGAWVSNQSEEIENREKLEKLFTELDSKFKKEGSIPKPENWGGYRLKPEFYEFWQGRPSRLHDRICYELENGDWRIFRLAP